MKNTQYAGKAKKSFQSFLAGVEDASHKHDERWATRVANTLHEEVEPVKPEPPKRTLKKYPSFDTWIAGSPHDSDEYDTDLEIDDFVKSEILFFNSVAIHILKK